MRYSRYYAMAASVVAIAIAAPVAWHLLQPNTAVKTAGLVELFSMQPNRGEESRIALNAPPPAAGGNGSVVSGKAASGADADKAAVVARDQQVALQKRQEEVARQKVAEAAGKAKVESQRMGLGSQQYAFQRNGLGGQFSLSQAPADAPQIGPVTVAPFADFNRERSAAAGRPMNGSRPAMTGIGRIASHAPPSPDAVVRPIPEQNRDRFEARDANPVKSVAVEPVSTFSIDVDTASYAFVRRALNAGRLPPKAAVRVEEMINYFPYDYPRPDTRETPFKPTIEVVPAPWNAANRLVHIAIKGYDLKSAERPRANLVFLVDVSGSMAPADKLPLVKNSLRMLLDNLQPDDTVAIVTYASGSGVVLERTKVSDKTKILSAIDGLRAGGSTAGAQGIQDAYRIAEAGFETAAVNRVILATDGDFNVGITNCDELKGYVERKRKSGIFLSILGVGRGNYNDALMQTLAQNGNGAAVYVDTLNEARKVLVEEASSTLFTIAKDVKIQIEFNPARVSEYRLIGYETRMLKREDFNNDKVDAGDVGSGHAVTALYEVTPVGAPKLVEDLRYQPSKARPAPASGAEKGGELGFLKLRYKLPAEEASRLSTLAIGSAQEKRELAEASQETRFSIAVAAFGQLLRGLPYMKDYSYDDVIALASGARGEDRFGYRAELVNLVRLAKSARP